MNINALKKQAEWAVDINAVTNLIAQTQLKTGEIPWSPNEKTDPWDHIEAAMGLTIGGHFEKAQKMLFGVRC